MRYKDVHLLVLDDCIRFAQLPRLRKYAHPLRRRYSAIARNQSETKRGFAGKAMAKVCGQKHYFSILPEGLANEALFP
jgi:hypothetical protein